MIAQSDIDSILADIKGESGGYQWRLSTTLCLMGSINHLLYVAAIDSGAAARVEDERTGKSFIRFNAKNRPKLFTKAGFRACLSNIETYLKEYWPGAGTSRRIVRECNDLLEKLGGFKRHVFFEKNNNEDIKSSVRRYSFYTRVDVLGLVRLFEALEGHLQERLAAKRMKIGDRIIRTTQDLYAHGAMFMQSLFAFVGASDKPFASGEAPAVAPGSPEAIRAQIAIADDVINGAQVALANTVQYEKGDEALVTPDGEMVNPDDEYSRLGTIFRSWTDKITYALNIFDQWGADTPVDEAPDPLMHVPDVWDDFVEGGLPY